MRRFFAALLMTAAMTSAVWAQVAMPAYHPVDSAVICALIENNGLTWNKNNPGNWPVSGTNGFVRWNSSYLKRITHFSAPRGILTGDASFEGLDELIYLSLYDNQLTSLTLPGGTRLDSLDVRDNQLTSIDVSKNTGLKWLLCGNNPITELDVSNNTALRELGIENSQLTALDVSKNTALTSLNCSNNQLAALDVSKNTALVTLYCNVNRLTTLDVSKNTGLKTLSCANNWLTSLDLTGLNLTQFWGQSQFFGSTHEEDAKFTLILTNAGDPPIALNVYTLAIPLNSPTFTYATYNGGITYENGILMTIDNSIASVEFTVQTGVPGRELSGVMNFIYSYDLVSITSKTNRRISSKTPFVNVTGRTLNIKSFSLNAVSQVRVIDTKGRTLRTFNLAGSACLPLAGIPAGRYFVEVRQNGNRVTSGFVLR